MNEQSEMRPGNGNYLAPTVYALKGWVYNLFPVPKKNAVATNDLDNAITLLRFNGDNLRYWHVNRNYTDENSGDYSFFFMDVYSDEEIGYSQTRGFARIWMDGLRVEEYTIVKGLDGLIGRVECLDHSKGLFAFSVLMPNGDNESRTLKVLKFKGNDFAVMRSMPAGFVSVGYNPPWRVYDGKILIYDIEKRRVTALDAELNATDHPFASAFNKGGINDDVEEFVIHRTCPFALVYTEGIHTPPELYLLRWDSEEEQRVQPLLLENASAFADFHPKYFDGLQLSPDGKWLVMRDKTGDSRNPTFVAFPIDSRYPFFLGEPLILGKVLREDAWPESSAWTTDPVSFVVTDGLALYRWELGSMGR